MGGVITLPEQTQMVVPNQQYQVVLPLLLSKPGWTNTSFRAFIYSISSSCWSHGKAITTFCLSPNVLLPYFPILTNDWDNSIHVLDMLLFHVVNVTIVLFVLFLSYFYSILCQDWNLLSSTILCQCCLTWPN